jgi:hypothetical protein
MIDLSQSQDQQNQTARNVKTLRSKEKRRRRGLKERDDYSEDLTTELRRREHEFNAALLFERDPEAKYNVYGLGAQEDRRDEMPRYNPVVVPEFIDFPETSYILPSTLNGDKRLNARNELERSLSVSS